ELHAGSLLQYRGLFLSGLARFPDRGCSAQGNDRMVTATSACSIGCGGVDLSKLECITYVRAVAHIFWLMRTVKHGTLCHCAVSQAARPVNQHWDCDLGSDPRSSRSLSDEPLSAN